MYNFRSLRERTMHKKGMSEDQERERPENAVERCGWEERKIGRRREDFLFPRRARKAEYKFLAGKNVTAADGCSCA